MFAHRYVSLRSSLGRDDGSAGLVALAAAGLVFLVAIGTHYEVLSYWFTGSDTLTLIEKSRMRTPAEAWQVFSSPLMYGTNFSIVVALFYRPVANLSYAVDFALWGLDPFGYHLTDLLLHAAAAVGTFAFVRRIGKDTLVAFGAGCLLAIHPITAEVVPTPARRHDVLATIFVLGSVLLFVRATRADRSRSRLRRWGLIGGSVLAYLLAVGAKEIGILAPPLVGAWFLLVAYDRDYGIGRTLWRGVKITIPYTVVTLAYLWWRIEVLGGLGGYRGGPWKVSEPLLAIASKYVLSLVYPVDLAYWLWGMQVELVPGGFYAFLAGAFCLVAYALWRVEGYRDVLASDRGRLAAMSIAWLVILGAVFVRFGRYSLRSGYVALVPTGALLSLVLVSTGRELAGRVGTGSDDAVVAGDGGDAEERTNPEKASTGESSVERRTIGFDLGTIAVFCLVVVLVGSLVWVSPFVYSYDDWERAGEVASEGLPAAASAYEESDVPPRAVIAIAGIPRRPGSPGVAAPRPQARTIAYFYANTIASWIRLTQPDSKVATYVGGRLVPLGEKPVDVNATIRQTVDRRHYRIRLRYPLENATNETSGA
ncbi:hypothetical protein BRD01_02030 [Halobacteriales archaeon QS_8_65_32]|nr:MAG: hypothetical protein BRD01_02030 [Halobacteriales archaeon QS_8_65_32]